jgi:hypothetical protein
MDDAFAVDVAGVLRRLGLAILKKNLALRAGTFGRLTAATHEPDVTHDFVIAQVSGDGKIVDDADGGVLADSCGCALQFSYSPA